MRSSARRPRAALALAAAVALVTACGSDDDGQEAAGSSTSESSSAAEEPAAPDLASGLLAAEAFGPDAAVVAISPEQLAQGAGLAASGAADLEITQEECAVAVEGTQPDFDDFDDIAAQSATTGSATTVEVLVRGGPTKDTVSQLEEAATRCTFEPLEVADLGDGAALLRYTTAVALPDGTQATVPALIGAVQDGDRVLILMNLDTGAIAGGGAAGAPADPAAFAVLLEQAYEAQAAALD